MSKVFGLPEYSPEGVKTVTTRDSKYKDMMMDIRIYKIKSGDVKIFSSSTDEQAALLLKGKVEFAWEGKLFTATRRNVFDDGLYCLHVPANITVTVKALEDAEVLLQKTENSIAFASKIYTPVDCSDVIAGEGLCDNRAIRLVRTAFDYSNAPYSNMVLGEVITLQGNWSSYIPHYHPQPEVYYYQFDKPQGFGAAFIGDDVFKIKDGSFSAIPGGKTHPQVTAPGYRMYVCWMIRHLEGNPWKERIDDEDHTWLIGKKIN